MRKRFPALSLPGVLLAGVTFVVLYLIIGVALWVAFVATGGALLAYGATAALARGWAPSGAVSGGTEEPALHVNPIVDVGVLRARYLVTLGLALTGGFLVVDSFAFSTALMELRREGRIEPRPGGWLLHGSPPARLAELQAQTGLPATASR